MKNKKEDNFKTLRVRIPIQQWKKVEGKVRYGEISKLFRKAFKEFCEERDKEEK